MNRGIGGEGVGEVVDRVGEQGHRAGDHDDEELHDRGDHEGGEGDLDGADAALVALQGGIDRVGGVVAVGPEDLQHGPAQPARMGVATVTVLVTVRPCPWSWSWSCRDRATVVVAGSWSWWLVMRSWSGCGGGGRR